MLGPSISLAIGSVKSSRPSRLFFSSSAKQRIEPERAHRLIDFQPARLDADDPRQLVADVIAHQRLVASSSSAASSRLRNS